MSRRIAVAILVAIAACAALAGPCVADTLEEARSEVAELEAVAAGYDKEVKEVEDQVDAELARARAKTGEVKSASREGTPYANEVRRIRSEIEDERETAAQEIAAAEAAYADRQDSHDRDVRLGLILIAVGLVAGLGFLAVGVLTSWEPRTWLSVLTIGGPVLVALVGVVLLVTATSVGEEPTFSDTTLALAEKAGENPLDEPTPELAAARKELQPYKREAIALDKELDRMIEQGEAVREEGEDTIALSEKAHRSLAKAEGRVESAEKAIAKEERFKSEAQSIEYGQLIKNPDRYFGEPVVYTGQVFQIQEGYGENFMLLSVTDEGYGFWTDEIWVSNFHTSATEEDIITVYGTVVGAESYETKIGGTNYVPKVKARYVED